MNSNSFFTGSCALNPRLFFMTHFSICHSFLDSYIGALLARKLAAEIWRERLRGRPGWHSGTVAQEEEEASINL